MTQEPMPGLIKYTISISTILIGIILLYAPVVSPATRLKSLLPGKSLTHAKKNLRPSVSPAESRNLQFMAENFGKIGNMWVECFNTGICSVKVRAISDKKCMVSATVNWKEEGSLNELIVKSIVRSNR